MPDHPADRERGKESGRQWAPERAKQPELDQLRDMYEQQGLGVVPTDVVDKGESPRSRFGTVQRFRPEEDSRWLMLRRG